MAGIFINQYYLGSMTDTATAKNWWDKPALIGELVTLGHDLYKAGTDKHIIGIGQSPYYPMFAANCFAIAEDKTFSHAHLPMTGHITAKYDSDDIVPRNFFPIVGMEQMPVRRMSENIGALCKQSLETGKTPVFFDLMMGGNSFASVLAMLAEYDIGHKSDMKGSASFLCMRDPDSIPYDSLDIQIQDRELSGIFSKNIDTIATLSKDLSVEIGQFGLTDNEFPGERLVPKALRRSWGIDKPLLPETPTSAAIKHAIICTVADRYHPGF